MHNPKLITCKVVAVMLSVSTVLYSLRGSGPCFDRVIHRDVDSKCACRDNATGTDGTCDASSIRERYHEYCDQRQEGYWFCRNKSVEVGYQALCTTQVNWTQWTKCYALGGLTCVATCFAGKMTPACLACIARFGTDCFGCRIRYCQEGDKSPLRCLQAEPGYPAISGCPYYFE